MFMTRRKKEKRTKERKTKNKDEIGDKKKFILCGVRVRVREGEE